MKPADQCVTYTNNSPISWAGYSISMRTPTSLELTDDVHEALETLEFKDDVLLTSFNYGHLIVATRSQVFVHRENNWHSPIAVELRDKSPQFVKQSEK